jgi:hypothetical protein
VNDYGGAGGEITYKTSPNEIRALIGSACF